MIFKIIIIFVISAITLTQTVEPVYKMVGGYRREIVENGFKNMRVRNNIPKSICSYIRLSTEIKDSFENKFINLLNNMCKRKEIILLGDLILEMEN